MKTLSFHKKISYVFLILGFFSCSNRLPKIPLEKIPKDLLRVSDQLVSNILRFCKSEIDYNRFRGRCSTKSLMQLRAGKYELTCYVFENEIIKLKKGELYEVNPIIGGVKRFKYKLDVFSDQYDLMELHIDLNSEKNIADYKIYGKPRNGEWISVLDYLELEVRKSFKNK